jgi:hypothetical protein
MFKKKTGFVVATTVRQRITDLKNPGMMSTGRVVVVAESMAKVMKEALVSCPSDKELVAISIDEIPVLLAIEPWEEGKKDLQKPEEKKDESAK